MLSAMRVVAIALLLGCSSATETLGEVTTEDSAVAIDSASEDAADTALPEETSGEETTGPDSSPTDTAPKPDVAMDAPSDTTVVMGSLGCGKTATAGVTKPTITVGTLKRTYVLSIPTGYDSKKPYPLMFAWHGRTGSGTGFRSGGTSYGGSVEKAAAGKAIFVYPDGLPVTSDPSDTGWVDTDPTSRDFAFFDALLAEMSNTLCVDAKRVFSYGHSFGAFMTNALGCHRTSKLRGLGPVAGGNSASYSKDGGCKGPIPVWIHNDKDDKTVLYTSTGVPGRDHYIKNNVCDATKTSAVDPSPCVAYGGCTAPLHWCASSGVGHGWPSYGGTGLWNFFTSL
jgi:polyhydroxybutyrate depolymerase